MASKPRFEISSDVQKCCDYLRDRTSATYSELSAYLGRDVQRKDRYVLENARRVLEREGIVFVVRTRVGVERASNLQVSKLATETPIDKIKRTHKRAKKRQRIVNVQDLNAEDRAAFYIGRAVLGAIEQATRTAFRNAARTAVNNEDGPLSIEKTIALFSKLGRTNSKETD